MHWDSPGRKDLLHTKAINQLHHPKGVCSDKSIANPSDNTLKLPLKLADLALEVGDITIAQVQRWDNTTPDLGRSNNPRGSCSPSARSRLNP